MLVFENNPIDRLFDSTGEDVGKLVLKTVDVNAPPPPFPGEEKRERTAPYIYRTAYQYIPSKAYASVQTSTITVLRRGNDEKSAKEIVEKFGLIELSEKYHFILILPNSENDGWNYKQDPSKSDDVHFLDKVQFALSQGRDVNAHSSLSYYIGIDDGAAMAMTAAAVNPQSVTSVLAMNVPRDFSVPQNAKNAQLTAWLVGNNEAVESYIRKVDDLSDKENIIDGIRYYENRNNPAVRLMFGDFDGKDLVEKAWKYLFSNVRRWGNNTATYGTYEERIDFIARGFEAHVSEQNSALDENFPRTWYEYVPERVKNEKKPLLIGLHGGGCEPIYYAEQNRWQDVADKEGFALVLPEAAEHKHWNFGIDYEMRDDEKFILNLITYMDDKYGIDRERVYIAGFSNGAQMTNTMAALHPEVFAAAAPSNAFFEHYFPHPRLMPYYHREKFALNRLVEEKKSNFDYEMPLIQTAGLMDRLGGAWPTRNENGNVALTYNFWKKYNDLEIKPIPSDSESNIGVAGDEVIKLGKDERFELNLFRRNGDSRSLYAVMTVNDMPHSVDLRAPFIQWKFMSGYSRKQDGTLCGESGFDKK